MESKSLIFIQCIPRKPFQLVLYEMADLELSVANHHQEMCTFVKQVYASFLFDFARGHAMLIRNEFKKKGWVGWDRMSPERNEMERRPPAQTTRVQIPPSPLRIRPETFCMHATNHEGIKPYQPYF